MNLCPLLRKTIIQPCKQQKHANIAKGLHAKELELSVWNRHRVMYAPTSVNCRQINIWE